MRVINVRNISDVKVLPKDEVMVMLTRLEVHRLLAELTKTDRSKFNADLTHSLWESLK